MATGSVARIGTNAMMGDVLWRSATSSRFSAALGIARTSSALRSLARKFQAHRPRFHELFIVLEVFCCPRISLIFVQASAKPNLFELCRAQPKMSKKSTRIIFNGKNGDLFGRTNLTNSMSGVICMSCGVVTSRQLLPLLLIPNSTNELM